MVGRRIDFPYAACRCFTFLSLILISGLFIFGFLKATRNHFDSCVSFQGNDRGDEAATDERCPDGRQEVGSEPSLNDIAEPTGIQCSAGKVGVFLHCEEDQARSLMRAAQLARRFDAVQSWHRDIEYDDIRMEPVGLCEECSSIAH